MVIRVCDFKGKGIQINHSGNGGPPAAPPTKEQICYDLHIGDSIKYPGDSNRHLVPKKFHLKPNDCILIETREEITVPSTVFGTICSRASLTAEGLVVANLKIDPKFTGKLHVAVYNTGKNIISLDRNLPFCSLFFQMLETAIPADAPIRTPPDGKIIRESRLKEKFFRSLPFLATFGASVLASLIASYVFGWFNPQKPSKSDPTPATLTTTNK